MNIEEYISSGIIEMYCMGTVTDEERIQVEKLASENQQVRDEIAAISEALNMYAIANSKLPVAGLKYKVMGAIAALEKEGQKIQFPPRLSPKSKPEEWFKYFADNNITTPQYDLVHVLELPSDKTQYTYIAWANKGMVLEETHEGEEEYYLMLTGRCSFTIDGKIAYYSAGDIVYIPKQSLHRAEVLSDEPMIVIGQRVAA